MLLCLRSGPGADGPRREHVAAHAQEVVVLILLPKWLLRWLSAKWLQPRKASIALMYILDLDGLGVYLLVPFFIFFCQGPIEAALRHHEVPDNLQGFLRL